MIAAHVDEPRRLLLEAETHGRLWSWVVSLHSNIRQLRNNAEEGQVLTLPVGYVMRLGFELATSWMGLCGCWVLLKGRQLGRTCSIKRWSWLFTLQALVRVIGNSKCCQQFLGGREYRVLDKAHSYWTCSTYTIPHHLQNNLNSRYLKKINYCWISTMAMWLPLNIDHFPWLLYGAH